jgi:hypothetical protein
LEQAKAEHTAMLDMIQHPGWKALVRQTQERLDNFTAGSPFNINTIEQLYFAKGMTATLKELINLETMLVGVDKDEWFGEEQDDAGSV